MKYAAYHNKMVKKKEEIDLRIGGQLYLARNVAFEECSACEEKVIPPEVSEDLFEKIRKREFVEETLKIPVLDATYG